jgi:hypothetical protein
MHDKDKKIQIMVPHPSMHPLLIGILYTHIHPSQIASPFAQTTISISIHYVLHGTNHLAHPTSFSTLQIEFNSFLSQIQAPQISFEKQP